MRRTKIVCTLGPAVDSEHMIRRLIGAGMNVARLNCSHGDWETRRKWIAWVRMHSPSIAPVALLADLQGPKFRIGDVEGGTRQIKVGQTLTVGPESGADIPINQLEILHVIKSGSLVLLGDGDVELKIRSTAGRNFESVAMSGGAIKSKQGVTVVGESFVCPTLTPKDFEDLEQAAMAGVDFVALSYVHTADDIREVASAVRKFNAYIKICAKIETRAAVKNIREIALASDVVMVARGDMGLQMSMEEVPLAQKEIIRVCRELGRPVITATQMLESMIHSPRPTRAEATDVANAILDGTDAVMLSGETASGAYPLEAVRYMAKIAERAETLIDPEQVLDLCYREMKGTVDHTRAVAHGVARLAALLKTKAIVTTTTSGRTACLVSKFRPKQPILCAAWNRKVQAQMAVVWGVECMHVELPRTTDEQIEKAISGLVAAKRLKNEDRVIVSAGVPPGTAGNTNLILVHTVKA